MLLDTLDGLESRYSDFDGWYLWGHVRRFEPALALTFYPPSPQSTPLRRAVVRTCSERFSHQLARKGLLPHEVAEARLRVSEALDGLNLALDVTLSDGRQVSAQRFVSARPHDPRTELRSTRREPEA